MPVLFTVRVPDKPINELYAYNYVTSHKPHQATVMPSDACLTSALLKHIISRL